MFKAELQPEPGFESKMYDIMFQIANKAQQDRDQLNDLPYLLSKEQLAKHVFNISPQSLRTHVLIRPDFPKVRIGERVLYPKDKAIEWITNHTEIADKYSPARKIGIVK
ncbi:DNA-binding protein [Sediminibacillus terrae]|uniref:DNA-binding protein n=1 Tax=Sediminibacillus terrae TaxID=1562106 RepID=UPI001297A157|nr:DNA-binding protein [Sediminibacillus terrae]